MAMALNLVAVLRSGSPRVSAIGANMADADIHNVTAFLVTVK